MASAPFNTTIDNLVYSYGSTNKNELRRVADGTNAQGFKNGSNTDDDYAYDANGNMITDKNKGITAISYNQLNLPVKIEFGTNKIEYLYNATGQKVQKKVTQGSTVTTTDYLGGFQYNGTVLDFFPHAEGYIKRETTGVYTYVFNYTDHLGNVRVSYKKNGSTLQILEESNYYPFGLKHEPNTVVNNQPSYKYKYNGKELQDELGLNMYDYGARNYDPALGRWMNIDPKAELSKRWSPYNYCYNNPMRFVDPDGMMAQDPIYRKNFWGALKLIGDDGKKDGKIHIVTNSRQANDIEKQTKAGNTAINLSSIEKVSLNGGEDTVKGVVASVEAGDKDTSPGAGDAGLHEEGGHTEIRKGTVKIIAWSPGLKKIGGNNASITPFNGVDMPGDTNNLLDMWHTHTSGQIQTGTDPDGKPIYSRATGGPSGSHNGGKYGDTDEHAYLNAQGYNQTSIQVDMRGIKTVNFYNQTGTTFSVSYESFKKLAQ